jgi:hypothetical protein
VEREGDIVRDCGGIGRMGIMGVGIIDYLVRG